MIYPIVLFGDPVLRTPTKEIVKGELDTKKLAEEMYQTMYNAHGVGLAAPQIGMSLRMFVIDGSAMDEDIEEAKIAFINPQIIEEEGEEWAFEEGCLSIPSIREDVFRKPKITIRYFDEDWNEKEETFDGIVARIIQHEYDHIEGVLFTDYVSPLKKRLLKGKLTQISKGKVDVTYRVRVPAKK